MQSTKASGRAPSEMVLALRSGQTERSTMDSGATTTWMAMGSTSTQTRFDTMDNSLLTKSKATAVTLGQMDADMRAGGTKANSMDMGHTSRTKTNLSNKESGRMASDSSGSHKRLWTRSTMVTLTLQSNSMIPIPLM